MEEIKIIHNIAYTHILFFMYIVLKNSVTGGNGATLKCKYMINTTLSQKNVLHPLLMLHP